jgi:hydroxymethylpyrimidine/phosphomethylpyrimidine kinase
MPKRIVRQTLPCALTIAGSDSGGGAGIQADLKTFCALRVHGTSAITCITAQNPREVRSVQPIDASILRDQIDAVFLELPPKAVKTGMLFSAELIDVVADRLKDRQTTLILDPVMISTSGAKLLQDNAIAALKQELLPIADLITPNLNEAEFLLQRRIRTLEDLRAAAREFHARYGCAALLKGGHLRGPQAVDFYYDGEIELLLEASRVAGISTHGTGCSYSAAITAYCARGANLSEAAVAGKTFISNAIASSQRCCKHYILNPLWSR